MRALYLAFEVGVGCVLSSVMCTPAATCERHRRKQQKYTPPPMWRTQDLHTVLSVDCPVLPPCLESAVAKYVRCAHRDPLPSASPRSSKPQLSDSTIICSRAQTVVVSTITSDNKHVHSYLCSVSRVSSDSDRTSLTSLSATRLPYSFPSRQG